MSDTFDHEGDAWASFDDWLQEPNYGGPYRYGKRTLTCRVCNKEGLHWGKLAGRWVLYQGDVPHKQVCPAEKF